MNELSLISRALQSFDNLPAKLQLAIDYLASQREVETFDAASLLAKYLPNASINDDLVHVIGVQLRKWDREIKNTPWTKGTEPHSLDRRSLIYARLGVSTDLGNLLSVRAPVFQKADLPIVISESHTDWYGTRESARFHWNAYTKYLVSAKGWNETAVAKLDESTDDVIRRLADPLDPIVYQARGLVVGYVQSGKTANFSGVLAKAADAGYRLIIVLAGTLDILREQTQRRLDKEVVGRELLNLEYSADPDWDEFMSHGVRPSEQGSFDWERLTGSKDDYRDIRSLVSLLEFKRVDPSQPFNSLSNLRTAPVRLIVIKKIPKVLARLTKNLGTIQRLLADVPALVVDDESDQASINTSLAKPVASVAKTRTKTNNEIVKLLKILPRAQYVGYTATPFANVFVDPSDAEDLYPRDFIVALPRPDEYMGVADFHDFDDVKDGFASNERAYVRDVVGPDIADDAATNLQAAVDSFVLAGALKLFRAAAVPSQFSFKHHTMLVHHTVRTDDHDVIAKRVNDVFESSGYHGQVGVQRLKKLFDTDFAPVALAKAHSLPWPDSFNQLKPFIGQCLTRLTSQKTVLIVNGDNKADTPDFDKTSVWAILVGGTKLSRGYTVEGLTITYFRRVASATDTLMQMGRWFGFRPGYKDLVRLFIGRAEPFGAGGKKTMDLYSAFEAMCLDEEKFRGQLSIYSKYLTPKQVPPLVPSHLPLLRPAAKNKMYNAVITFRNFGGQWSESTLAPITPRDAGTNSMLAAELLATCKLERIEFNGTKKVKSGVEKLHVRALAGICETGNMLRFIEQYKWNSSSGTSVIADELQFIRGQYGDPRIARWLILVPLVAESNLGSWPEEEGSFGKIPVQKRSRIGGRFKAYSTSDHRAVAEYLAQTSSSFAPAVHSDQAQKDQGVVLLYPVRPPDGEAFTSIGFSLLFPHNQIKSRIEYSVRQPENASRVTVDVKGEL